MVEMDIGYFGDERLRKGGELLLSRVAGRQSVHVCKLADNRAEQAKFRRFLANGSVTAEEMVSHRAMLAGKAAEGRHVLAIQDTTEINFQAQCGRKRNLGTVGNGTDVGLFLHPVLAIDAESEQCLGLVSAQVRRRLEGKAANYKSLPIEKKESHRWIKGGEEAKAALTRASKLTILDDREGDIYEKWARLPDRHTHLLTRACQNRSLAAGGSLFPTLAGFPEAHRYMLEVTAQPGKRSARLACMAVRFGTVRVRRPGSCSDPNAPEEIELFAVETREIDPPHGEKAICWRLLTTHTVENVLQAMQVIGWYRLRWYIEQLFRTLKRQGLRIEQSVVEDGEEHEVGALSRRARPGHKRNDLRGCQRDQSMPLLHRLAHRLSAKKGYDGRYVQRTHGGRGNGQRDQRISERIPRRDRRAVSGGRNCVPVEHQQLAGIDAAKCAAVRTSGDRAAAMGVHVRFDR